MDSLNQESPPFKAWECQQSRTIPRQRYSSVPVAKRLHEWLENQNYAVKAAEIGRMIRQVEDGVSIACDRIEKHL